MENRTGDMTPFDRKRKPVRQNPLLLPVMWGGSWICTRGNHLKIHRELRGIKPPYLVISTHQGFSDYYIAPLALFPYRANYVSDMEGFAAFGNWLYRNIGCIGKRRYVADLTVVQHMKYCLKRGNSVVVFPESRHSNVGTTAKLPDNMGHLAKVMKVPVVVLSVHGSYLANPFWDEEHARKVPLEAELKCLYTATELETATAEEVQEKLYQALQYDEYKWQKQQGIKIRHPKGAEGLHKALYQCRACGTVGNMDTKENCLFCKTCGAAWELTEDGELLRQNAEGVMQKDLEAGHMGENRAAEDLPEKGQLVLRIPDWYEWQREQAIRQFEESGGSLTYHVKVEALPSEKGFAPLGEGILTLTKREFVLEWTEGQEKKELHFLHKSRESVQTEYNYKGKGECIVLSTLDCCYYIYPFEGQAAGCSTAEKAGAKNAPFFSATWFQFVGEELYDRLKAPEKEIRKKEKE